VAVSIASTSKPWDLSSDAGGNVLWHLKPPTRRPIMTSMARVLIVQGHARSRADTAATRRAERHDVLEAGSADHGVRVAHEQGPEVILLDPMLPDRSGYELYASLQRDPATLAIPVLFLPGEAPHRPGGPAPERRPRTSTSSPGWGWPCAPRRSATSCASPT
jgi:response regulator receiver domain-containing protein